MLSRGLLRAIQKTKVQGNPPAASDEANLRIPSSRLLKRNERYASIKAYVHPQSWNSFLQKLQVNAKSGYSPETRENVSLTVPTRTPY
ncbi:unnamed protein product [Protopolystoma xenopodis]|uniref:Uncharacterized protein n=1 Tax=Protopolystoma xenopodis TaxID=117903 RepID=A0A448W9S6_9PLAT|nr:unnamed protein product [Protopolystoma xenopodis]